MRRSRSSFFVEQDATSTGDAGFDLLDDWALIEASFLKQYGLRLRTCDDLSWDEFCDLLAGLTEDTPLARVAAVRTEDDPEILATFNHAQLEERRTWRAKQQEARDSEEYDAAMDRLANMFIRLAE